MLGIPLLTHIETYTAIKKYKHEIILYLVNYRNLPGLEIRYFLCRWRLLTLKFATLSFAGIAEVGYMDLLATTHQEFW